MDHTIFLKADEYISKLLGQEDAALKQITAQILARGIGDMSVSANQGKFIQVLAAATNPNRILELGTFGAYSTIWLARALKHGGKLITVEYDAQQAEMAAQNIAKADLKDKIELRVGKALDVLSEMIQHNEPPFDFIFIDADKPPYTEYFQIAIKLSRPGTIIVCDNVIRAGKVLDENTTDEKVQGVQRLNNFLSTCKEVTATIIQTVGSKEHDGMVIAVVLDV